MVTICSDKWVKKMAEALVCEILEVMSDIHLRLAQRQEEIENRKLEAIYGFVKGDYQIGLRFLAEPRLFSRLAQNMAGSQLSSEEIQEYAMEFFNVLCGRFLSELYKAANTAAKFYPTKYELYPNLMCLKDQDILSTLYFISDEQELAAFSWSAKPIIDLLRRSMNVEA